MEPVILTYKGNSSLHTMNIVAGYSNKEGVIFLVREGLNTSLYKLDSLTSETLYFGIESSLKQTKKSLEAVCGEKFSFKGKRYLKLTRAELIEVFQDRVYQPVKLRR